MAFPDDESRDCAKCGQGLRLLGGCEWPDDEEQTLCWSCQHAELELLRGVMERLPASLALVFGRFVRDYDGHAIEDAIRVEMARLAAESLSVGGL